MNDTAPLPPPPGRAPRGRPSAWRRALVLPAAAVLLIAAVLGIQLASGGGGFTPLRAADPCVARPGAAAVKTLDALTERLVLLGLDGAACRLGVSRETLTVQLAQTGRPTARQVTALRAGLLEAVDRMKADGTLPPASDLTDEALANSDLNGLLKAAIRLLPDSVINNAVKTDDVLRRTINGLDLTALLGNLNHPDDLNRQVNAAVTDAVKASLLARVRGLT